VPPALARIAVAAAFIPHRGVGVCSVPGSSFRRFRSLAPAGVVWTSEEHPRRCRATWCDVPFPRRCPRQAGSLSGL